MIPEDIRRFIGRNDLAWVASADETGRPHLATGHRPVVTDASHLSFEAWFCPTTLRNVAHNPRVAVVITAADSGCGYQLSGNVEKAIDTAILDGFAPGSEAPGTPQVCSRLVIRIDGIMEFSSGAHTDRPLG